MPHFSWGTWPTEMFNTSHSVLLRHLLLKRARASSSSPLTLSSFPHTLHIFLSDFSHFPFTHGTSSLTAFCPSLLDPFPPSHFAVFPSHFPLFLFIFCTFPFEFFPSHFALFPLTLSIFPWHFAFFPSHCTFPASICPFFLTLHTFPLTFCPFSPHI